MNAKNNQLEFSFMNSKPDWLTTGLGRGLEIGLDPLGTAYSIMSRNYSGTAGGNSYIHLDFSSLKFRLAKVSGFALGLVANIASYGLGQAAYTLIDIDKLACQYFKKRQVNPIVSNKC